MIVFGKKPAVHIENEYKSMIAWNLVNVDSSATSSAFLYG